MRTAFLESVETKGRLVKNSRSLTLEHYLNKKCISMAVCEILDVLAYLIMTQCSRPAHVSSFCMYVMFNSPIRWQNCLTLSKLHV
jgi:hypothetical protein